MGSTMVRFLRSRWFLAGGCVVLGAALVFGIRFVTYQPKDEVHYHANFALYVNGQRELFKGARYYEETAMCAVHTTMTVSERAHMHDLINDVVHVEDHAVTWSQFFSNLGWTLGPNFIQAPDRTMYLEAGDQKLHILLNRLDYTDIASIANTAIKDDDQLLVSFGTESTDNLTQQYDTIAHTAHQYDIATDPASCSGHTGSTLRDRLQHLL